MSFWDHGAPPCHGFEPFVVQTLCIMSVCGCTYEANPEWRGGFELKPTSFQNLLWFVCIIEVFGKITLYVSASHFLK